MERNNFSLKKITTLPGSYLHFVMPERNTGACPKKGSMKTAVR
jgi:hypothetical protein